MDAIIVKLWVLWMPLPLVIGYKPSFAVCPVKQKTP